MKQLRTSDLQLLNSEIESARLCDTDNRAPGPQRWSGSAWAVFIKKGFGLSPEGSVGFGSLQKGGKRHSRQQGE